MISLRDARTKYLNQVDKFASQCRQDHERTHVPKAFLKASRSLINSAKTFLPKDMMERLKVMQKELETLKMPYKSSKLTDYLHEMGNLLKIVNENLDSSVADHYSTWQGGAESETSNRDQFCLYA